MELKIQIISKETLKPSSPTPSQTFKLSFLDQIFPILHIPVLLFYTTTPEKPRLNITTLKTSLSETLSLFYPLAGRCMDNSHVSCNDEGVPFLETFVNYNLMDFLISSNKLNVIHKFLPPHDSQSPLSFQINVFACGGFVIGCHMLHKLLDASSLSTFFQCWATLATKGPQTAIEPDFDTIIKVFPPQLKIDGDLVPVLDFSKEPITNSRTLIRCFRITNDAISALKRRALSGAVLSPTSFESVAGFIWENIISAVYNTSASIPESTTLSLSMNMRPKINPPLPKESMGNCVTIVQAKAVGLITFPYLVKEIHEQIIKAKFKIEKFQGENGIEEICLDRKASLPDPVREKNESVYYISSWCKLGLSEADFGLGKSKWIIPTDGKPLSALRNIIMLTDYNDEVGDGVEVCLILAEKEMRFLESSQQFLDYATLY